MILLIVSLTVLSVSSVSCINYGSYSVGQDLSIPRRIELENRCPRAFSDVRYNECKEDSRYDWSLSRNSVKAECCFVLDDAHCLRKSLKRNCNQEDVDSFDEIMSQYENNLRYNTECRDYFERSQCHFPLWAIIVLSLVGSLILIACIGGLIYWRCSR